MDTNHLQISPPSSACRSLTAVIALANGRCVVTAAIVLEGTADGKVKRSRICYES